MFRAPALSTAAPLAAVFLATLSLTSPAQAAAVSCGNAALGVRQVVVDPALAGGYCHAQDGNLQNADIDALGLTLLAKEVTSAGDVASPWLGYTANGAGTSGTWTLDAQRWNLWERLFLGFHFGGGGPQAHSNPDSFVVELARADSTGQWRLTGPSGFKANALSNIYLMGLGPCTNCGPLVPSGQPVPTPSPLALLAAAGVVAGLLSLRRRRAAQA